MDSEPDKANGQSDLRPYLRRRRLERQLSNHTEQEHSKATSRGHLLQLIRELFGTGVSYEYVDDVLRTIGFRYRTRRAMLNDALGPQIPVDTRSDEEKEEARIALKALRPSK